MAGYRYRDVVVTPTGARVLHEILRHERGERAPVVVDEIHPATLQRLIHTGLMVATSRSHGVELTGLGWRVAHHGEETTS